MVWLTAVALCFAINFGWYISQDLVLTLAQGALGEVTGQGLNLLNLIEFLNIIWGPLFDILVILWAIVSSQARDPTSVYY
jgi:hypothetical protein